VLSLPVSAASKQWQHLGRRISHRWWRIGLATPTPHPLHTAGC